MASLLSLDASGDDDGDVFGFGSFSATFVTEEDLVKPVACTLYGKITKH